MSIQTLKELTAPREEFLPGADIFHYDIKIEYDDGRKDYLILTDEDNLNTPALVQLLSYAKFSE